MKSLARAAVRSLSAAPAPAEPVSASREGTAPAVEPLLRPAIVATAIGLIGFLLIQGILAAYNVDVIRDAFSRGQLNGYPSSYSSLPIRLLTTLVLGSITYLVFALSGLAIASRGHRLLFMLPAAGFVLVAVVGTGYGHQPQALGTQWQIQCFRDVCNPWFAHPWLGPLVDLALVLIPGWFVAVRVRTRRWPGATDPPALAAMLVTVALVATAAWTIAVVQNSVDLDVVVAVGGLGIVIGTARPWWPWLHVLFAVVSTGALTSLVWFAISPHPLFSELSAVPYIAVDTWPIVAIGLLASGWRSLAWVLRKMQERPLRLVIAVNLLNLVDAVMTMLAVRSGGAVEANPLVRFGGLPAKVVLVGVLTWALYRRRPASLVWPAAALFWVACYHVSGILVNGWRSA